MKRWIKLLVFYPLEFVGAIIFIGLFWALPFRVASGLGGSVSRAIGPFLGVSRIARRNLKAAFPDMNQARMEEIVAGMWENLGRTIGEYPALRHMDVWAQNSPLEIVNAHILEEAHADGKPALLFLGHLANWEYATLPAVQKGIPVAQLFRTLNNPYIAKVISWVHTSIAQDLVTKSPEGARKMLEIMRRGGALSMLVDQKLREGIPVPFFGRPAMTPQAIAKLALKFDCPLIPVRVERLEGVRCRVTYYPPISLPTQGSLNDQVYEIMCQVNKHLEDWIRERPEQWIWVHNRWPS